MPRKKHRKHTPIESEAQRGLFGAELARRRAGEEPRMLGITTQELIDHLKEAKGKDLPARVRPKGSAPFSNTEMNQGYRRING